METIENNPSLTLASLEPHIKEKGGNVLYVADHIVPIAKELLYHIQLQRKSMGIDIFNESPPFIRVVALSEYGWVINDNISGGDNVNKS